jgi:hypothetical protein
VPWTPSRLRTFAPVSTIQPIRPSTITKPALGTLDVRSDTTYEPMARVQKVSTTSALKRNSSPPSSRGMTRTEVGMNEGIAKAAELSVAVNASRPTKASWCDWRARRSDDSARRPTRRTTALPPPPLLMVRRR